MLRFNSQLLPADILVGRNQAASAIMARRIRLVLGSWSNHNAMIVESAVLGGLAVGDTTPPRADVVALRKYEELINAGTYQVRIWRVRGLTDDQRRRIGLKWYEVSHGLRYANHTLAKLAVFRFVNSLPWRLRIHGTWCSENTARPFTAVLRTDQNPLRKPDAPLRIKKNVTPRTFENRLVCGILGDVTEKVLVEA